MTLDALARAANFRDLGGLLAGDGARVATGALFRSGELAKLGPRERAELSRLGLRTIVDLRTETEVARRGRTLVPPGARLVRLPIDSGDLTSRLAPMLLRGEFDRVPSDLLEQVNRALVRDAGAQLRAAMDLVTDPGSRPLLFHCTHGKDRTGLLAMVVLLALDVPWPLVLADYLRSNDSRTAENRRQYRTLRLLSPLLTRRPFRRPELTSVKRLFIVAPENLHAARAEMEARHGTVDGYLEQALGLVASRRAELRRQLVHRPA